jgi:starch synthase
MSLRYGTIPVVRATGGLADTIVDYKPSGKGTGFVFKPYDAVMLAKTVKRAIEAFHDKPAWTELVDRALRTDFSWNASARKYVELYKQAIEVARPARAA